MLTRALVFLSIALSIWFGLHYLLWARLLRDAQLPSPYGRGLTGLLVALALAFPLEIVLSRALGLAAIRPLQWTAYVWMGVGFLAVSLVGGSELVRLGAALLHRLFGPSMTEPDPARRLFLARALSGGIGAATVGLSVAGMRSALATPRVVRVPVALPGLPPALDGFKLVQLSDVHIGPLLQRDFLAGVVDRVASLSPDAVVITGDLVDGSVDQLREHVAPLARLSPPRGTFFVTGNHEYYSGADAWLAHLPKLGVRPLRNQRVELSPGLDLAGIDDASAAAHGRGHGADLARALAGRDPQRPLILLAHQPKQFDQAAEAGVALTLSGHTHGGQIWPFGFLVALAQPFVAGLHRRGGAQLYVSRGTGFWGPPLRVLANSEITLIELRPA